MLHVDHASSNIHNQHDLVIHNTNKDCLYVDVDFLALWKV
jgi:hypothetical protein